MPEDYPFEVAEDDAGKRLDVFLSEEIEEFTRSFIQKLIAGGLASVNRAPARASYRVKPRDLQNCRCLSRRTRNWANPYPWMFIMKTAMSL